jgi:predicted nucleic-acid-binding Zn-ribbon protein
MKCPKCGSKNLSAEFLEYVVANPDDNYGWSHFIDERAAAVEGYPFIINLSVTCRDCKYVTLDFLLDDSDEMVEEYRSEFSWGKDKDGYYIETEPTYGFMSKISYKKLRIYFDQDPDQFEDSLEEINQIINQLKQSIIKENK